MIINIIIHRGESEKTVSESALIIRSSKSIIIIVMMMMISIRVINIRMINIRLIIIIMVINSMTNLKKETRGAHLVEDE